MSLFCFELLLVKIFAFAAEMKVGHSMIYPSNTRDTGDLVQLWSQRKRVQVWLLIRLGCRL